MKAWNFRIIDIKTAFLQSFSLQREVYLQPPMNYAPDGTIWRLRKAVYGLADASRQWHLRASHELKKLGFLQSQEEPCVFIQKRNGRLIGFISTHVDDFWIAGKDPEVQRVIKSLQDVFDVGTVQQLPCKYLGTEIQTHKIGKLSINLGKYADEIDALAIDPGKSPAELLNEEDRAEIKGMVGKLLWPAMQVKPELCFKLSKISSEASNGTVQTRIGANKLLRTMKNMGQLQISFTDLDAVEKWVIVFITDASFNNNTDGTTHAGHLIFIVNKENFYSNIVARKSGKLRRIARSTIAAECYALTEDVEASKSVRKLVGEMLGRYQPIYCLTDIYSVVETVYSSTTICDKKLRVEVAYLRKELSDKEIEAVKWIETRKQLADCLTKQRSPSTELLSHSILFNTLKTVVETQLGS